MEDFEKHGFKSKLHMLLILKRGGVTNLARISGYSKAHVIRILQKKCKIPHAMATKASDLVDMSYDEIVEEFGLAEGRSNK